MPERGVEIRITKAHFTLSIRKKKGETKHNNRSEETLTRDQSNPLEQEKEEEQRR